ncbi:MAG: CaiB/BaiF CoA-transferase family protein, partial [Candidatus Binatia bacterium]|nr:CaiB/BaiF CoA-transferase family protein [Candidatus Binatia bacterium]
YSAMFFADFGAEVIKVDPPGSVFPIPELDSTTEFFAAHFASDRNKKSVVLNLKSDDGREAFYRLVKRADVLIEGFSPKVMKRLKTDYDTLKEINPGLIYCSLSGYGHTGPYADLPGHDMNYCGIAGATSMVGERNGQPYLVSNYLADMAGAGLHGVIGVLIALMARQKTGQGQFVDVTYIDGVISLLAMDASFYFATGKVPRRGETYTTGAAPWANVHRCKDGEYITLGCAEPHFWENLCRALGREDFIPYQNPPDEKKQEEVTKTLKEIFLTRTRDEWFEFFKDKDTCFGPVYNLDETFSDPQVKHREMVVEIDHPRVGKVKQIGIPIKLSETPGQIRSLGTLVGAHTDEILHDLGYSQGEIRKLREEKAIG